MQSGREHLITRLEASIYVLDATTVGIARFRCYEPTVGLVITD